MISRPHDVVVVGGGPGGYATALRAAVHGLDVAIVEQGRVGGTCLHVGCIPSKAGLHAASILETMRGAGRWGLSVSPPPLDVGELDSARRSVIDQMESGLTGLLDARTTRITGRARVAAPGRVEVHADGATEVLEATHVVVATGSVPQVLRGVDVDGRVVQTSDHAVHFTQLPERAVVVGGGAIGLEMATTWAAFGTHVTVVEALDHVLPLEDSDVSTHLAKALRRRGIDVLVGAQVKDVTVESGALVDLVSADGPRTLECDVVLLAIGRRPRTEAVGLHELGVLDDRGYVVTDDLGQTEIPGLWAVGDIRPTLALAHAAFAEGFVVADSIAGVPDVRPVDHRDVPRVTFSQPEVASVGWTEVDARATFGDDAVVATVCSTRGNARSLMDDDRGFVKVVALRDGPGSAPTARGEVLGVHAVGEHATDLIGEAALATSHGLLVEEAAGVIHAHPTRYEAVGEAMLAAAGLPFHTH